MFSDSKKTKGQHTLAIKLPERLACDRGIGDFIFV